MIERWSNASVALHWMTAALVAGLAAAGFVMSDLPADANLRQLLARSHTIFGILLMVLTVARLVVRWRGRSPAPLPLAPLHRRGVDVVHGLIYVVLFGLGASGVATAAGSAWPAYVSGELASAPALEQLASRKVHEVLVLTLLGLVGLHVAGVLIQQLRGVPVVARMLPGKKRSPKPTDPGGSREPG